MSALERALCRRLQDALGDTGGGEVDVATLATAPWASATFTGARYIVRIILSGPRAAGRAADFVAGMDDLDFALARHVVADIALAAQHREPGHVRLDLELLAVET